MADETDDADDDADDGGGTGEDLPGGDSLPPARRPGRPPKLTEPVLKAVTALLMAGNFRSVAAKRVGVNVRTFQKWMALGERFPDGVYGRLRRSVLLAEAESEAHAVGLIQAAAREDWKAAAWLLERKRPQRWGRQRDEMVEVKRSLRDIRKTLDSLSGDPADPSGG